MVFHGYPKAQKSGFMPGDGTFKVNAKPDLILWIIYTHAMSVSFKIFFHSVERPFSSL